ncbi:hypothetical protein RHGRI_006873 [Rhododendron griersonianum]|uniref:Digalactosyldiacylglycerol synthase 1, chloroplastic n=1 Tax=Rhododendron griersonianum TaxID=479676 RepID=A0AAV6KVZ1_9ERIC|nr:hypothetical protein RHGRI_006873 [Rhododendron griersonianum]
MINLKPPEARASTSAPVTADKALSSIISRGWKEVRDSADADLRLMKNRANSFKDLASSFDRELENFLNSASKSTFAVPAIGSSPSESDFVKRLRPKLNAIVSEVDSEGAVDFDEKGRLRRGRRVGFTDFRWEESHLKDWEPVRALKTRLRELERKSSSSEILESLKNSEFVEKVKSSLIQTVQIFYFVALPCIYLMQGVPPLDVPELFAYLVRQSGPFLDQLGIRRDISDKIVESLCSKRKNQLLLRSTPAGESSILESDNVGDELDVRIASVLQSTGHCYEGGFWTDSSKHDTTNGKRHVAIVTTASLPWMTGTAVNPLFRAAYLSESAKQDVTLLVPWLCRSDQELVYPNNLTFSSPEEQEAYIRNWVEERVGFKTDFKISFYPGKFQKERRSIMPAGDTSQFIPSKDADIAILEEPEHLNWYHHGKRWTDKFNHVVGIVHTNYLEYIKREKNGAIQAFFVKHINNWVMRAYCHKVLRLSAATQDLPKSVVCNVHGVNPKFLKIGEKVDAERERGEQAFTKGAYFLGKMVWAKGYRELIDLLAKHKKDLDGFDLDVFGNGEDAHEVQSTARKLDLNLNFMKGRDHADDSLHGYKVFINPSVSDVLCTATAEALAMGKFVVCADHPSNEFFRSFPNCMTYSTPEDFVAKVREAMANEPQPLTSEQRYNLSWEAATQRFMQYSELDRVLNINDKEVDSQSSQNNHQIMKKSVSMPNLMGVVDGGLAFAHYCFTGNEFLRRCTGAMPGTREYDMKHSEDLHLLPPQVENPIYGW